MSKRKKKRGSKNKNKVRTVKKETPTNVTKEAKVNVTNNMGHTVKKGKSNKAALIVHDNWACCAYMISSILASYLLFPQIKEIITAYVTTQNVEGGSVSSNSYTKFYVIEPFAGSVSLLLIVILAFIFLKVFRIIIKKFGYEINNVATWLLFVEVITIILSAIAVIYYSNDYQIRNLGIDANAVRNGSSPYAHIIEIPNGYGMVSPIDEGLILKSIKAITLINMKVVKNIDLYMSIIGSIFIPLKVFDFKQNKKRL